MGTRKDGLRTRKRILDAAVTVFSRKGFRDATIGDICRVARTNTASVNYHFRGKETLYVEAWRLAFQRSVEAHPPAGGVLAEAPPEERLRGRVLSFMQRILDPASHEFEIVHRELASPTNLLVKVMRESIEPIRRDFGALVRELLGEHAPETQVLLCLRSTLSQCLHLMVDRRRPLSSSTRATVRPPYLRSDVETLAEHVTRFSLAGIREVRRQIERGTTGSPLRRAKRRAGAETQTAPAGIAVRRGAER